MLSRIFIGLAALLPGIRQVLWKTVYRKLATAPAMTDVHFMNYGYRDALPPSLDEADEPDRPGIQLYERVVRGYPLAGARVVEVGCGRGYGSRYLARYHRPASLLGCDFAAENIRLCRERHGGIAGLAFADADAAALPCPDRSVDVVINVESSHCYPDRERFRQEVGRIVTPGGLFLWADLGRPRTLKRWLDGFSPDQWETLERAVITDNVLDALDHDADERARFVASRVPRGLRRALADFSGVREGAAYRALASGRVVYCVAALRKKARA